METFLKFMHIGVSGFMILVILLQAGRSGGLGALGGSAAFGARGTQTILSKITTVCAALFMMTSLSLAYISSRSDSLVLNRAKSTEVKAPEAPPTSSATTTIPLPTAPTAPTEPVPAAAPTAPAAGGQ